MSDNINPSIAPRALEAKEMMRVGAGAICHGVSVLAWARVEGPSASAGGGTLIPIKVKHNV